MSKKKSWLCLIKGFFFPEPRHHHQRKERSKGRRRWPVGRPKTTKALPPPPPLPPPAPVETAGLDAREKQSRWEEDVSKPVSQCKEGLPKSSECITVETDVVLLNHQREKDVQSLAVIKIQVAYRGYLARKALRALKGFVRLQAIIRGRAVRRQAMTTLRSLQAFVNIQSEVCSRRSQMAQCKYRDLQLKGPHDHKLKVETKRHTRMDGRLLSKEEEIDLVLRKKEAILRRQGSKPYSSNHMISTGSEEGKAEGRLQYWLEQYVNDHQVLSTKDSKTGLKQLKLKTTECSKNNLSPARRSFHIGMNPGWSPRTPAYMAATESAKAKARSTSTPRPRPVLVDRASYSDGDSPYKHSKVSPMSSTRSEMTYSGFSSRVSNKSSCCCSNSRQKSPNLKGVSGPVKSAMKMKDVGSDSESLLVSI